MMDERQAPSIPTMMWSCSVSLMKLLMKLLFSQVWSQQVPMNCVIKREQEKCMEMITSEDLENDPEFGRLCSCLCSP